MANVIEGKLDAGGMKLAIIVSRFNNFITEKLLVGASVPEGGKLAVVVVKDKRHEQEVGLGLVSKADKCR